MSIVRSNTGGPSQVRQAERQRLSDLMRSFDQLPDWARKRLASCNINLDPGRILQTIQNLRLKGVPDDDIREQFCFVLDEAEAGDRAALEAFYLSNYDKPPRRPKMVNATPSAEAPTSPENAP